MNIMNEIIWSPKNPKQSNMWQFMVFAGKKYNLSFNHYQDLHAWSVTQPQAFWSTLCDFFSFHFDTPFHSILDQGEDMLKATWFKGARFNFAQKLLRRRDQHPALICLNEAGDKQIFSYQQLYLEVAQCAAGLRAIGIGPGDRVAAMMPNSAPTVIAMLASASLGAIWSSCSPDFGVQALLDRLGQIDPKVLFVCDGHAYQGKKYPALEKIKQLQANMPSLIQIIICPTIQETLDLSTVPKALYWQEFIKSATHCLFASLPFDHPLTILFSSGTTGKPKCIVHGAGGTLLQHLKELGLHTNIQAQDNLCFYTTCGWMMWNWSLSTLALGATLTLYEGSPTYPTHYRLFELIDQEKISVFGTSAKFLSTIEKMGAQPKTRCSLSDLRCILSTGSPLLPKNYDFVYQQIKAEVQLSSISGGTDIISCFALGNPMLPVYKGELQCIGLGMDVAVFNEEGLPVLQTRGELVCTRAFPSMPIGFWKDPDKIAYSRAYFQRFPGVWTQGDFAEITSHHGLIIYGRSDAVLNPGGVRIGTAEIYRQIEKIEGVIDSIVIDQDWQDDVRIVLFLVLAPGIKLDEDLIQLIKKTIKENASPRHVPAKILQVGEIPRTINGKIVEIAVRQVVHHQPVSNLSSLANPKALDYFKDRKELESYSESS